MSRFIRSAVCAIVLSSICTTPVLAAEAARPDTLLVVTEKSLDCAGRYMAAMHMDDTMTAMTESMVASMKGMLPQGGSGEEQAKLEKAMGVAMKETMDEIMPKVMEDMEPAMLEVFNEAEMCALADFYESATGQSIIRKMPALMQVSMDNMKKHLPAIQQKMIDSMCRVYDCKGTPLEKARPS